MVNYELCPVAQKLTFVHFKMKAIARPSEYPRIIKKELCCGESIYLVANMPFTNNRFPQYFYMMCTSESLKSFLKCMNRIATWRQGGRVKNIKYSYVNILKKLKAQI